MDGLELVRRGWKRKWTKMEVAKVRQMLSVAGKEILENEL